MKTVLMCFCYLLFFHLVFHVIISNYYSIRTLNKLVCEASCCLSSQICVSWFDEIYFIYK